MYQKAGRTITGESYIRTPEGIASVHLPSILEELEREGCIAVRQIAGDGTDEEAYRKRLADNAPVLNREMAEALTCADSDPQL